MLRLFGTCVLLSLVLLICALAFGSFTPAVARVLVLGYIASVVVALVFMLVAIVGANARARRQREIGQQSRLVALGY